MQRRYQFRWKDVPISNVLRDIVTQFDLQIDFSHGLYHLGLDRAVPEREPGDHQSAIRDPYEAIATIAEPGLLRLPTHPERPARVQFLVSVCTPGGDADRIAGIVSAEAEDDGGNLLRLSSLVEPIKYDLGQVGLYPDTWESRLVLDGVSPKASLARCLDATVAFYSQYQRVVADIPFPSIGQVILVGPNPIIARLTGIARPLDEELCLDVPLSARWLHIQIDKPADVRVGTPGSSDHVIPAVFDVTGVPLRQVTEWEEDPRVSTSREIVQGYISERAAPESDHLREDEAPVALHLDLLCKSDPRDLGRFHFERVGIVPNYR
ncbi:MAG: hypothetical protein FJX77_10460 [Armatimonadetes bacterium]|nr:hypothetical protein [Armatimonadota bacterium]